MASSRSKVGTSTKFNVLLLEPNYKNKYPPIGLMKISTYHKMQGHSVTFFKGDLNKFLVRIKVKECLKRLRRYDGERYLSTMFHQVESYIRSRRLDVLANVVSNFPKNYQGKVERILREIALSTPKNQWNRIYVTTLFTFYWDITIKTIEFAKNLVDNPKNVLIGGVMASLLKEEVFKATGIDPHIGLLNSAGLIDPGNSVIIDELSLDYSILGEIEYRYPTQSAYFAYMTKGCTRKCAFCSVPKLEPSYIPKIDAIELFNEVKHRFGDQRNLMLMDNNILASPMFPEIVQEIKRIGFSKDAIFYEPNQLDISIANLRIGRNDKSYTLRSFELIHNLRKRLRGATLKKYDEILHEFDLITPLRIEKKALIKAYKKVKPYYEKHRWNLPMKRYVDFNQGIDARYVTDKNMALMSELPIKPLRIAFDHIGIKSTYVKAVELAAKYGINDLSNYILYNFQDKPEDFYERLKINVDLGKRLGITIFSFPMKYVPLFGEEAKNRKYVGKNWNKKYLRAIQCILNTTKGIVAPGYDFFQMSFGRSYEEFKDILMMPEAYIVNRIFFEKNRMTSRWKEDYESLEHDEREIASKIILENNFDDFVRHSSNPKILRLLSHYSMKSNKNRNFVDVEVKKLRRKFNKLIRRNIFINLTLTHDFENGNLSSSAA